MITKETLIEDVFKKYQDPELGIDVWTLGLIYNVEILEKEGKADQVKILLTFTSPLCPYGPQMVAELQQQIKEKGVEAEIEVTFDPPWQPSEELREMMGVWEEALITADINNYTNRLCPPNIVSDICITI